MKALEKVSRVGEVSSLGNENFRNLKSQLRRLKVGVTHASVLQALANMCREEEAIVDQQSYKRKRGGKVEASMKRETSWKRRFVIRASDLHDDELDSSLLAKYAKQKCRPGSEAIEKAATAFSTNVQELLLAMTTRFATDINEAFVSDASHVMTKFERNPEKVMLKICQVESDMKSINEDMRKLAEAKSRGVITAINGFTGLSELQENDSVKDEEASENDASDISEESESQSTSDSDGSNNSSEWVSDDESSLDSNFIAEMAFELGFDIDDEESDETVVPLKASSVEAAAKRQTFIPQPSLLGLHKASANEQQMMFETCCISLSNTDDVENVTDVGATNCTPALQIKPKLDAAPRPSDCRDAGVLAKQFESTSHAGIVSSSPSLNHGLHTLNSMRPPRTEFDCDVMSGGEDCDLDDSEVSQRASPFSHIDDPVCLVPSVNVAGSESEKHNEAYGNKTTVSVVSALHKSPTPLLPWDQVGAESMPELITLRGIPQRRIGQSPSRGTVCSSSLPCAATPIAIDTVALHGSCHMAVDPQSESGLDDDSDDDSENDSGDDTECDSDVEYNDASQSELSTCLRLAPGLPSPAVPHNSQTKVHKIERPSTPLTPATSQGPSSLIELDVRALQSISEGPSGIGMNVGCFDATGKPNKKAAISYQRQAGIYRQACDYLSDLCIAARFAAALNDDVVPSGPTATMSWRPQPLGFVDSSVYCKSESCTDEKSCRDGVGGNFHQAATECRGVLMQDRYLTSSLHNSTDGATMNGSLLVDWNVSDDALLVTWSEGSDSDSDTRDEGLLVGWGSNCNGDDELEQKPIVSTWKRRLGDTGIAGDFSPVISDTKLYLPGGGIKRPECCVESPKHGNIRDSKFSSSVTGNPHNSDTSPVPTEPAVLPKRAIRRSSTRGSIRRQDAGRQVAFHDAFKTAAASEYIAAEEPQQEYENVGDDAEREVTFPRINFGLDRKRAHRLRKRDSESQSTRRRRKLRENEIKSAVGVEMCYIEGLCILNRSRGKAIASQIYSSIVGKHDDGTSTADDSTSNE